MNELTDIQLIEELKVRLNNNQKIFNEQQRLLVELESLNQKLVASENLKSQFLSNIRNEINNPLTSILGLAKNLALSVNDQASVKRKSGLIYQEAFSLDFQLRNVFVAAELESGELAPEFTHIDINQLLDQLVQDFNHQISHKNINLKIAKSKDIQFFNSDAEKIYIILTNLLSNAIKFGREEGQIEISIEANQEALVISIKDDGIGIDEKYHDVIYNRFTQVESGSTKSHLGHGLGLSITKDLLEMIGGEIRLESEAGKGSKFTVVFPKQEILKEDVTTLGGNEFLFNEGEDMLF